MAVPVGRRVLSAVTATFISLCWPNGLAVNLEVAMSSQRKYSRGVRAINLEIAHVHAFEKGDPREIPQIR